MSDDWPMIQTEREACAELFESLNAQQWTAASWCGAWNVREVAGHLIAATLQTPAGFFGRLAKAGFSFNKMVAIDAYRCSAGDPSSMVAAMASGSLRRTHPPGPLTAMLGEAVVHGEDIRRPLGMNRAFPEKTLVTVADFYKGSNLLIGTKRRIAGLSLKATDAAWSTGDGPEVSGPMASLILAMTGRRQALADLSGEGVAALKARP